jgi:hypothetical protein
MIHSKFVIQAPAMYDSSGILNVLPRFRIPFQATWARVLNTNTLDRREGKHESYWPVGVTGDTFMCLILKVRNCNIASNHAARHRLCYRDDKNTQGSLSHSSRNCQ